MIDIVVIAGLSLLWNLVNSILTFNTSYRLRKHQTKLDEYRRTVATPLEASLEDWDDLLADIKVAKAMQLGADSHEMFNELSRRQAKLVQKFTQRLRVADASKNSENTAWEEILNIREDSLYECMNKITNELSTAEERSESLGRLAVNLDAVAKEVRSRISEEIANLS